MKTDYPFICIKLCAKAATYLAMTTALSTVMACSSGPQIQEYPDTANVTQEYQASDAAMKTATRNQVNVLAPQNYSKAKDSLEEAKSNLEKQKDSPETSKDILHQIAKTNAYLNRANEVAALSRTNLPEVIAARSGALTSQAPEFFTKDFASADEDLRDLTSDFEKGDVSGAAKNSAKLQANYLDLELKAIKQTQLDHAQKTIELAIKEGAPEFAVQSLAIAQRDVRDFDAFITANRHNAPEIANKARVVNLSADHLLKITHDSKKANKVAPEEMALQIEQNQKQALDQGASDQAKIAAVQGNLNTQQGVTAALKSENQSLETEKAFNLKFEQARSLFSPNEAEIYRLLSLPVFFATMTLDSFAIAEETTLEKFETQTNESSDSIKSTYRDIKDQTCHIVHGKLECLKRKIENKAKSVADTVQTKQTEFKNKVD